MEYKSKLHKEMVEDFKLKKLIVECLYSNESQCCEWDCLRFYDCFVKPEEERLGKLEQSAQTE